MEKITKNQPLLFSNNFQNTTDNSHINYKNISSDDLHNKYIHYSLNMYINDIEINGLEETWDNICDYVIKYGVQEELINIQNFGELYEIGLATQDKI